MQITSPALLVSARPAQVFGVLGAHGTNAMRKLLSTADVHPRDRFDYWYAAACREITMHDSVPENRLAFEAELQTGSLAEIRLLNVKSSPTQVAHTTPHIGRATDDELLVCRQRSGAAMFEQNGREVMLEAGDVTLLDPLLPYTASFAAPQDLLVLKVPRLALEARIGKSSQMVACAIKPSEAEGGLTSAFLAMLPGYAARMQPPAAETVSTQALDLIALSFAHMGAARPKVSSSQAVVSMKVRAAIESRLAEPALDSDAVAGAAGIGVRYANEVLAREGTSIARLIRARRLERCRRALHDPTQERRTVSEIAYGWGFTDMTHFGRSFKAAFGMLPSEFRASDGT
jgi:AraC family transcriptional regulator, positive regulator of tynA and feaB